MACEINVRGEVIRRGRGGATTTVEIQEAPNGLAQRCPVAGGAVKVKEPRRVVTSYCKSLNGYCWYGERKDRQKQHHL
ncbi:hypothetical protein PInf_001705 [Phytophthora infestans]|nr:hypothetical protein PInf_001705 [Phytophthora infestans]